MSDDRDQDSASLDDPYRMPDELPPVQPPSAGFIVQLFLIPALIVLAVVGVWALFGQMAAGEQDWRELVDEIKNTNEHRRWRGANGLADLLATDLRLGDRGQKLSYNPEIATALSELLSEGLASRSQRDDDLKQQAFLAMTLGMSDVTGTTMPVLIKAMQPDQDLEVRMSAVKAVAVAGGRAADRKDSLSDAPLIDALILTTRDENVLLRQLGTFALGLIPSSATNERLGVLLGDSDESTRINAAISLARLKSTAGLDLFRKIFRDAAVQKPGKDPANAQADAILLIATRNSLRAIEVLSPKLTPEERAEFVKLITPIASDHPDPGQRTFANHTLLVLEGKTPADPQPVEVKLQ